MLRKKTRWYLLFENQEDFEQLFELKNVVQYKSFAGEVLFVKDDEEYHAFRNKCPHQNKPLTHAWVEDGALVCPFHQYHFSCDTGRGHGMYVDKYSLKFEKRCIPRERSMEFILTNHGGYGPTYFKHGLAPMKQP